MKQHEFASVSRRLSEFVEGFAPVLGRSERRHWCQVYLSGLILRIPAKPGARSDGKPGDDSDAKPGVDSDASRGVSRLSRSVSDALLSSLVLCHLL